MNKEQIRLLSKMKVLINQGKKRFAKRKDRNYLDDLEEIGITVEQAWFDHIIHLNKNMFFIDLKPNYKTTKNTLIFKKQIKGKMVYIKLKLEIENAEEVVCLSFHIDRG